MLVLRAPNRNLGDSYVGSFPRLERGLDGQTVCTIGHDEDVKMHFCSHATMQPCVNRE